MLSNNVISPYHCSQDKDARLYETLEIEISTGSMPEYSNLEQSYKPRLAQQYDR